MEIQTDFKELFEFFNAHEVQYLIVGSYALAFHGSPRYTGDIDVYVKPVKYIGRSEFIQNKRSSGRKKDLADLEALGIE